MKTISLTKGFKTTVDDEDYDVLSKFKWHASVYNHTVYAQRTEYKKGRTKTIKMHRAIMGLSGGRKTVDHINHNGLDNRKENLRVASQGENSRNKRKYANNTSGFKCVYFHKKWGKWSAYISVNRVRTHLGLFASPEEAAAAYDDACRRFHGDFSRPSLKRGD